jgi:hypothetical protein
VSFNYKAGRRARARSGAAEKEELLMDKKTERMKKKAEDKVHGIDYTEHVTYFPKISHMFSDFQSLVF